MKIAIITKNVRDAVRFMEKHKMNEKEVDLFITFQSKQPRIKYDRIIDIAHDKGADMFFNIFSTLQPDVKIEICDK